MSNELVPFNQLEHMAIAVAKSKLFGMKTPEEAIALMLVAQSEGLHPARAALEYHIISGKPSLKADAMLSRFQNAGGKVEWKSYSDTEVTGVFSHPSGGSVTIAWSIAQATKAGLTNNPTWKKFPRAMLRARCISEGIRTVYPGVSVGLYTPEEVQDFPEKDITPDKPEPAAKPASMPEKVKEMAKKLKEVPVATPKSAPKSAPAPIEGQYTTVTNISGDPSEGDISMIAPAKADAETVTKLVKAFFDVGIDIDSLEEIFNKSLDEFTTVDITTAKSLYPQYKQQFIEAQQPTEEI